MPVQRPLWLRKTLVVWASILVVAIVVFAVLTLDASMTLTQRLHQTAGVFP